MEAIKMENDITDNVLNNSNIIELIPSSVDVGNDFLNSQMCGKISQTYSHLGSSNMEEVQCENSEVGWSLIEASVANIISSILEKVNEICLTSHDSVVRDSEMCLLSREVMKVEEDKLSSDTDFNITAAAKDKDVSDHSFLSEVKIESSNGVIEENLIIRNEDISPGNTSIANITPDSIGVKNTVSQCQSRKSVGRKAAKNENTDTIISLTKQGICHCPECPKVFGSMKDLNKHITSNHSPELSRRRSLCRLKQVKHRKVQSKGKRLGKSSTQKDFRSGSAIYNLCSCEFCGKRFAQPANLKIHLRTHTKERPYICELCGKTYSQAGDLKIHSRVHSGDKPYLCEFCGNSYHSRGQLTRHKKTHSQDRPHTCHVCLKSFKLYQSLSKHLTIHSNEKPYSCQFCGKAFSRTDYLKEHIRVHTKEKPYLCKICGKGFSQAGSLKLHGRVHNKTFGKLV